MQSSGYLVPPSVDPEQEKLWVETWKRIDRFLPELKSELAPEEPQVEKTEEVPEEKAVVEEGAAPAPEQPEAEEKKEKEVEEAAA